MWSEVTLEPPALHLLIRFAPALVGDFGVAADRSEAAVAECFGGEPSVAPVRESTEWLAHRPMPLADELSLEARAGRACLGPGLLSAGRSSSGLGDYSA